MKYTRHQIYTAINKAADHIEANPADYSFASVWVRRDSPSCMWGWIGIMLDMQESALTHAVADALGLTEKKLFHVSDDQDFVICNISAARTMRLFATKYFAPEIQAAPMSFNQIMSQLKTGAMKAVAIEE